MEISEVLEYARCIIPYLVFTVAVLWLMEKAKPLLGLFHSKDKPPKRMCDHTGASIQHYPRAPRGKAGNGWTFPAPAEYVWKNHRWECPVCKDIYG